MRFIVPHLIEEREGFGARMEGEEGWALGRVLEGSRSTGERGGRVESLPLHGRSHLSLIN